MDITTKTAKAQQTTRDPQEPAAAHFINSTAHLATLRRHTDEVQSGSAHLSIVILLTFCRFLQLQMKVTNLVAASKPGGQIRADFAAFPTPNLAKVYKPHELRCSGTRTMYLRDFYILFSSCTNEWPEASALVKCVFPSKPDLVAARRSRCT